MSRRTKTKHPVTGDPFWKLEPTTEAKVIAEFSRKFEGKDAALSFAFLREQSAEVSTEVDYSVDQMEDDDIESVVHHICKENNISFVGYNHCTNSIVIGVDGEKSDSVMFLELKHGRWEPSEMETIWKPTNMKKRLPFMFAAMEILADCKAQKAIKVLTEAKDALTKLYVNSFYALWS